MELSKPYKNGKFCSVASVSLAGTRLFDLSLYILPCGTSLLIPGMSTFPALVNDLKNSA